MSAVSPRSKSSPGSWFGSVAMAPQILRYRTFLGIVPDFVGGKQEGADKEMSDYEILTRRLVAGVG
jgi:hypothetical protein